MQLVKRLNEIVGDYHLLKHTFYQAWSKGELSTTTLQRYAAQYYHQVSSFPRFISRVHTHCTVMAARKVLLKNLVDEEIHGTDHPELWMQFAEGLGITKECVLKTTAFAETEHMVNQFYALADQDWRDGLCALYAYEYQVPEVSASKIAGLKEFYGIQDEATLEFFTAHQAYDVEHSNEVATLIETYADSKKAEVATEQAAKALWGFLDGMCHAEGIAC